MDLEKYEFITKLVQLLIGYGVIEKASDLSDWLDKNADLCRRVFSGEIYEDERYKVAIEEMRVTEQTGGA